MSIAWYLAISAIVFSLGAVILARRRRGLEPAEEEAARLGIPAVAPPGTGSMAEGTGSLSLSPAPGSDRKKPEQPTPTGGW